MKRILNRIKSIDKRDLAWGIGGAVFVTLGTTAMTAGMVWFVNGFISNLYG